MLRFFLSNNRAFCEHFFDRSSLGFRISDFGLAASSRWRSQPLSCTTAIDNAVVVFPKCPDESAELKYGFHFMHEREIVQKAKGHVLRRVLETTASGDVNMVRQNASPRNPPVFLLANSQDHVSHGDQPRFAGTLPPFTMNQNHVGRATPTLRSRWARRAKNTATWLPLMATT